MLISNIDLEKLKTLGPLFNQSAGYTVSLNDEINYFDPENAKSWFYAADKNGQVLGFIRSFKQNHEWSLGELFVDNNVINRELVAYELLKMFSAKTQLPAGHRLRFDVGTFDQELNKVLIEFGFSESKQNFLYFEKPVSIQKTQHKIFQPQLNQAKEIADVLSFLNPVTINDVESWIKAGSIRLREDNSQVVSAAQILITNDSIEINRIVTHERFLRCGHAKKLIESIIQESVEIGISKIYLKVEDMRSPAIATYKNLGFIEVKEKSQVWHSKWY